MPKRKHTVQRSRIYASGERPRPGFSRRDQLPPPSARRSNAWLVWLGGGAVILIGLVGLAYALGWIGPGASPSPSPQPSLSGLQPPAATPLANPPAAPAGDGTTATITTEFGDIVIELYTDSSPVAAQNFINLAEAGFYDGVVFHRLVPEFMIQGGDPQGTGGGGPGYTIPDEPIVGEYTRGTVAMARTRAPNSQGSQFFIVVKDSAFLANANPGYAIFGRVLSGMEVVDEIVALPTANDEPGGRGGTALDPVPVMDEVTIQRP
jgi:cyclophilin family peptidyl-prolyl cis-trans isomerase